MPAGGVLFNSDLGPGQTNDDVKRLQQLLASDFSIYPEGRATGYYGSLTANAVRKFQLRYGVIKNASDAGNGRVGPKTRAKLAEIFGAGQVPAEVVSPAAPSVPATPSAFGLTKGLTIGSQGDEVTQLQSYLASDPSVYPEGKITGYFGSLTQAAVEKFQEKYGLAAKGDAGYGFVGPKTRAKLEELFGGWVVPSAPIPAPVETPATGIVDPQIQSIMDQIQTIQKKIQELQQ